MNLMTKIDPKTETPPSVDELVDRAAGLRPILAKRSGAAEVDRRVSAETTALMADAGLFRLGQPKRFGGFEYGPSAMLRVGFELGRGCGSAAWCAMIGNVNAWLASYWPLEAQREIWADAPDNLVTGTFVPTGRCAAADGGYLLHGRWPFASNCENSAWLFVSAILPEIDGASPGVGWFMVPRVDLGIDQDSWHVSGMQGTGSKTLFADTPIFVPKHRMIRFADVMAGTTPGHTLADNPMAQFAFTTFGATGLVAPLLGMVQGALDWFVEAMQGKVRASLKPGAAQTVAHSPHTQVRIGEASAAIDAAMALLLADIGAAEQKIARGEAPSIAERIRIRRDQAFAARQACTVVNLLFEGAGASSASLDAPIQRYWRDVNAAARHASLDVQAIYGLVGQERFGFQPAGQF